MVVAVVLMAAVAHDAVATAGDLGRARRTVPGFIGVEVSALMGMLLGYGKFVMDFGRANRMRAESMRGQVRDLVGLGAAAMLTLVLHMAWTGTQIAAADATVPGMLGSTITEGTAALAQYGSWVLECSRGGRRQASKRS